MRNFDTDEMTTTVTTTAPHVRERVTLRARKPEQTYLVDDDWDWRKLRDYVVTQMTQRFGDGIYVRDPLKESGIFKGFLSRWGDRAVAIARYAFEERDGVWMGEPVTPSRFTKASDPYFSSPIADRLVDTPIEGW